MAALMMTPAAVRQPFATLDASRMRSFVRAKLNLQNKQNGAIMMSSKRQPLSDVDSENIDPITSKLSTKRKRTVDDDDDNDGLEPVKGSVKPMKTSRMLLDIADSTSISFTPSTPKSSPSLKPAGRSPQMKACKPFARRSTIAKNRPESASRKSIGRPFSIAAALSNAKPKSQSAPSKVPASWSFEIYVDSEQEEMTNLMQHSTCVLDISDDEGKQEIESNRRGKENIPPAELGIALPHARQQESPAAAARKSVLEEESRAPLGELHAADYYGEDCHAFSYAVVYDDETETEAPESKQAGVSVGRPTHPTRSKLSSVSSIESVPEDTVSPLKPTKETAVSPSSNAEIEIWESGSVTEEETTESTEAGPASTSTR
ncbi:hypothetical protein P175DRAFT_0501786 [Aspergillus ochraceoroseus IBT 24754]|uniref:Uncharacterized protein n=2 Tax=Aspergillus ochraceoroseus TaxID=138278 RepID=A0A2T5LXX1_9EURO|nr:uncharacterized protein P175DRAFT_0501786 [Aspergillus ochraceoroseus IBT 24754]KKK18404.1 hypothetical protein AOCH_003808 [Aspergillus ochraceoroseus]PTU21138.1 hypothetical protein P175DRAFT_0501786 [Aspergillus ochraceoroseus IBT 24754]